MLNTDQASITIEEAIAQLKKEGIKLDHHPFRFYCLEIGPCKFA